MNAPYRRSRWLILLGGLATPLGIAAAVAGVCMLRAEPDPGAPACAPIIVGILLCTFPTLLLGVGGPLIIIDVIRHRLIVEGDSITQMQLFRTKQVNLADVVEARWRVGGSGILKLKNASEAIKLEFAGYSGAETRQLIKFFHLRLPAEVQKGWKKFWEAKWRMFDEPDPARSEEFAEETRRLRLRLSIWLLLGGSVLVFVAVVVWFYTHDISTFRHLALLILLLPIIFVVSANRGRIAEHPDVRSGRTASLRPFIGLAIAMLDILVAIPFGLLSLPIMGQSVMYAGAAIGCLWMVIGAWRQQRRIRQATSLAAKLAEQEYMQPEPERNASGL
ncbi:MAG: hypothetical protein WCB27_21750 [Thermoguttaceae bacterium]|jgi:hypothetical protein